MKRLWIVLAAANAACRSAPETSSSPSAAPNSPVVALDRLDTRVSVPLLPMMANHQKQTMREHLVAVQEIVAGVGSNDFEAIEKASRKIGYSEQMGQMCAHMGAGAPGFTEQALAFHHTADKIGDAARARDMTAVLAALSETMNACTSCHATFKQHVVDDATFAAAAPGSHAMMH
jgi:Cytochrome C'